MEEIVKFLIVDDHPIFRHGLIALLEREPRYQVRAEAGSMAEALAAIAKDAPDMVLLDISLGEESGLDLLKILWASYPEVKTLVISIHDEAVYAERALRSHARGYLMKQEAGSVLREAVATILDGKIFLSASYKERLLEQHACNARKEPFRSEAMLLSDRELEVLKCMGQGYGAIEIAGKLSIAVKTVGVYQDHIKKKLSLESVSDLRKYAIEWVQSL
jgi:DNA-binding NarL/FixJ family response regulator